MKRGLKKCGVFLLSFYCADLLSAQLKENPIFDLRLKQAPLVSTLQELALMQETNLIIDDELEGSLSLQLDNVDFDLVLRSVAQMKGLSLRQEEGIYYLGKKTLSSVAISSLPSGQDILEQLKPPPPTLVSKTIKLHFAKASEVMKSLTTGTGSLLSPVGSIAFDERSNRLIIQDETQSVKNLVKLIKELDKPIEQIAIEARIVTITDESLKELGVRWGIFSPAENAHRVSGSLEAKGFTNLTDNLNVNFATNITPAGSLALQVAKINGRLLDLELTALERENNVEIIASPRLLTTNKKSASIKQGTEIPYVVTNGKSETQSVEFREAVLGLEVTPHISKDNHILLDLLVSQNSPGSRVSYGKQNNEVVSIDKQEINTQVFAKDGETIVLGGVFHDTIAKVVDKVPLLGDIPLIKRLFSKESERHQKRELVIFVTPHIIKPRKTADNASQHREIKVGEIKVGK
ncbi:type IV pilus secretin PilQ [Rodentibacter heidelbergensis]|uniref:Secretin n=1 Tax=Rodentibacter heidelbergensis TaxID=1908258 RepID=A0A1V3I968_9PAST|nr:type IV pilus secretin PilQ [Rodentibacter heidelbergensis]OOF36626.1 secretin [Rodentibacter heidelbergensis]